MGEKIPDNNLRSCVCSVITPLDILSPMINRQTASEALGFGSKEGNNMKRPAMLIEDVASKFYLLQYKEQIF